ncbi:DNA cytosine methyltransferase [Limobrevibacterium gyesilva]|uniref:DNA (cytosine-5-)-methyltransferase n=1 Tax=Limobrevibacterium gyesilva TaxID=2991712 RepID=A0AA42CH19_9PROT|nr:DNA cytosine methyltransferase [Limobrevibacterium gyesilva]
MTIRTLDLFCGGGGSSWGAQAAGATVVAGVDAAGLAALTYGDNFPDARAVHAMLQPGSGPRAVRGIGTVDLLLASPECTNHTCARGARERDEESRNTSLYVLDFVRRLQPRWVVIENVVSLRRWHRYGELLAALRQRYHVREQVLDAADFGVPQSRRRLFLACDRDRLPPDLSGRVHAPLRTARDILDPPGTWAAKPLFLPNRAPGTIARARRGIAALGDGVPFLIVYYGTDGAGGWQPLDRPLRTITTLDRFGLLEWTESGPTLRMLQVPELRRAMGFDESFRLSHGTRRDRIRLLGNGVCPPVMRALVTSLVAGANNAECAHPSRRPAPASNVVCGTSEPAAAGGWRA